MAPWDMYRAPTGDDNGLEVKDRRLGFVVVLKGEVGRKWREKIMKIGEYCVT